MVARFLQVREVEEAQRPMGERVRAASWKAEAVAAQGVLLELLVVAVEAPQGWPVLVFLERAEAEALGHALVEEAVLMVSYYH